ncbi:hypothetical protein EDB19DRAFT_1675258, partial [Suillus lakei]
FAIVNRLPPTLKPRDQFTTTREVYSHGFIGEYYASFVPTESISCPCGELRQTPEHILCEYPPFIRQRRHLREISRNLIPSEIMGTEKGNVAPVKYIEESITFKKDRQRRVEDDVEGRGVNEIEERRESELVREEGRAVEEREGDEGDREQWEDRRQSARERTRREIGGGGVPFQTNPDIDIF